MGRYAVRPNNPRLERPKDVATEAQIEDMFRTLNARVGAGVTPTGVSLMSHADTQETMRAGGGGQVAASADLSDSPRPAPNSNQAGPVSSNVDHGTVAMAPTPRGSLPNSLGTSGGSEGGVIAEQSVLEKPPALQWERVSPYAMRTLCRTWTCCKVIQSGQISYELYRTIAGLERPSCVRRGLESFDEAKEIAQHESDADCATFAPAPGARAE